MAIDINKTYSVPGYALALLVTAAGGGLVWGGFGVDSAQAAVGETPGHVETDLSAAGKAKIVEVLRDEHCKDVDTHFGLPADKCTPTTLLKYKRGNITIDMADRSVPPDGTLETMVVRSHLLLPDTRTVGMPD